MDIIVEFSRYRLRNRRVEMQVLLTAINSKYIHTGLGIRYVGEYAKENGHKVDLLEAVSYTHLTLPTIYSV